LIIHSRMLKHPILIRVLQGRLASLILPCRAACRVSHTSRANTRTSRAFTRARAATLASRQARVNSRASARPAIARTPKRQALPPPCLKCQTRNKWQLMTTRASYACKSLSSPHCTPYARVSSARHACSSAANRIRSSSVLSAASQFPKVISKSAPT